MYKKVLSPAHNVVSFIPKTVGIGLTVIEKLEPEPEHPLSDGITLMFPTIWEKVELLTIKDPISPIPLAPRPMFVLSFVQLNIAPGLPVKLIGVEMSPSQ